MIKQVTLRTAYRQEDLKSKHINCNREQRNLFEGQGLKRKFEDTLKSNTNSINKVLTVCNVVVCEKRKAKAKEQ